MAEAGGACRDVVRQHDKDMFLSTLFAPEAAQAHLFALHAFACELARIPLLVHEPQIGEIRLQWWADTLASDDRGEGSGHPVAEALAQAIRLHDLPVPAMQQMIEARRFDLYADAMPDMTALEAYFGETQSALMQLSCLVLDKPAAAAAAQAAGLAGVAFGLSRRMCVAPADKLLPAGHSRADVLAIVDTRLNEARLAMKLVPKTLLPALLPLALTELYLSAARSGGNDVSQWRRQWRLWRASRTERF